MQTTTNYRQKLLLRGHGPSAPPLHPLTTNSLFLLSVSAILAETDHDLYDGSETTSQELAFLRGGGMQIEDWGGGLDDILFFPLRSFLRGGG